MHQELIRELAMITDEERRILEGKQEIDPQLIQKRRKWLWTVRTSEEGEVDPGQTAYSLCTFPGAYTQLYRSNLYVPGNNDTYRERQSGCARTG